MPVFKFKDNKEKTPVAVYKKSQSDEVLSYDIASSSSSFSGSNDGDAGSDTTEYYDDVLAKYAECGDGIESSEGLLQKSCKNSEIRSAMDEKKMSNSNKDEKIKSYQDTQMDFLIKNMEKTLDMSTSDESVKISSSSQNLVNAVRKMSTKSGNSIRNLFKSDQNLQNFGRKTSFGYVNESSTPSSSGEIIPLENNWVNGIRYKEQEKLLKPEDKPRKVSVILKSGQVLSTAGADRKKCVPVVQKNCRCNCCEPAVKLMFGIIFFAIGIISLIWTPLDYLMQERLKMTPGSPAFDWWVNPPDEVYLKFYAFNVTNADAFLKGSTKILNFSQVGPITYLEKLAHTNTKFNENGTMTYTAKRWLEFLPELNKDIDLNSTLIVPNIALLGFASYLHDSNYFMKQGFSMAAKVHRSTPIINTTIYNYMWNLSDPLIIAAQSMAPGLVPVSNMGMLESIYRDFTHNATVYIGRHWGDRKFFSLDNVDGSPELPGFHGSQCKDSLRGSTEGLVYPQPLDNTSKLEYWRKTLCRVVTLRYEDELEIRGMKALKFHLTDNAYHRTGEDDCYAGYPKLYDGLSDVSRCFFNFPMAMSLPHFRGTDPAVFNRISGLKPDPEKHSSYAIVEPVTGVPLESNARSQSNLVIKKLKHFNKDVQLFSDMVLPLFWAEYSQLTLPDYIWNMTIFTVLIMPVAQKVFSGIALIVGLALIFRAISQFCSRRTSPTLNSLTRNVILSYEKSGHNEKLER